MKAKTAWLFFFTFYNKTLNTCLGFNIDFVKKKYLDFNIYFVKIII